MRRLEGKVAIVTGGAGSMGAAEVRLFAEHGARTIIVDRLQAEGTALEAELRYRGADARFIEADITSFSDWERIVSTTEAEYGGVDILVNNAGVSSLVDDDHFSEDTWELLIGVNLKAPFLGVKAVLPKLIERGGGSIVNIVSIGALIAIDPGHLGYTASKAGLAGFTRALAGRYGQYGVRANNVYPGAMPPMRVQGGPATSSASREAVKKLAPLGRIGEAIDVANAVLYLASDESSYVTGADIVVDGGVVIK